MEEKEKTVELVSQENQAESSQIQETSTPQTAKNKPLTSSLLYKFLAIFGFAFVCFIFIFQVVLKPIQIYGLSMYPTLNASATSNFDQTNVDIVFISKHKTYKNNDIIVANNTKSQYVIDEDGLVSSIIKRVVATEGQTIVFFPIEKYPAEANTYYYNFKVLDKNGKEVQLDNSFNPEDMFFTRSTDSASYNHPIIQAYYPFYYNLCNKLYEVAEGNSDEEISFVIPENQYFVLGDNRNASTDSRWFGFIKHEDIMGSVELHLKHGESIIISIFNKIKTIF